MLWLAVRRWNSEICLLAATCLIASVVSGLDGIVRPGIAAIIAAHLALLSAMLIGAIFQDALGRFLQQSAAIAIVAFSAAATLGEPWLSPTIPVWALRVYPWACIAVAVAYGLTINRLFYWVAAASLAGCASFGLWHGYMYLRRYVVGLDHIAGGMVFFLLAAIISLLKAGLATRVTNWRLRRS